MKPNNTLRIRHEANLTSYGTHHNGNCKPIICIELQKTFNSLEDTAEFFGVSQSHIWKTLNGIHNTIGLWERDENGKRIRRVCYCHLEYANNIEAVADKLMTNGRMMRDDICKANEQIESLKHYNVLLSEKLEKKSEELKKKDAECVAKTYENDNMRLMLKQLLEEKSALEKAKAEVARLEASVAEMEKNLTLMV